MVAPAMCDPQLAGLPSFPTRRSSDLATGSAVAGSTVVTITASPLGLTTKPATFTLTVVGAFDYSLSALPSTLPVTQVGAAGVGTPVAALNRVPAQPLKLNISALPIVF